MVQYQELQEGGWRRFPRLDVLIFTLRCNLRVWNGFYFSMLVAVEGNLDCWYQSSACQCVGLRCSKAAHPRLEKPQPRRKQALYHGDTYTAGRQGLLTGLDEHVYAHIVCSFVGGVRCVSFVLNVFSNTCMHEERLMTPCTSRSASREGKILSRPFLLIGSRVAHGT